MATDNVRTPLNYELMIAVYKPADIEHFAAWFAQESASAHLFTPTRPGLIQDVAEGLLLWLGFQL
jgi:cardiolipin synthase